ncbi:hypothetical protein MNBD_PLANCTO02-636 [hydrothermal vent metagenome]|uniref:Pyrrolo-quinoline quinone repeat domain-containing protein n=1 Tax=hydrothermal vent metagenome TaxID=652676 RepID=A0A3B1E268_9ZZZZ
MPSEIKTDAPLPADVEQTQIPETNQPKKLFRRLLIGAFLLVTTVLIQGALSYRFQDEGTQLVMYSLMVTPAMLLLFGIWWTFFSGFSRKIRWSVVGVIAGGIGLFFFFFKVVGFTGNMEPVWVKRWAKTHQEKLAEFLKNQKSSLDIPETKPLVIEEGDWASYRGPLRNGIVRNAKINIDWKANPPKEVWRHPVGLGWSSFAIVGEYAFTQEQRQEEECVVCYNAKTGKQIWVHADNTKFAEILGGNGPRATPTVYDSKVYALGANGILNCLNALSGKKIWSRNILKDAGNNEKVSNITWGMSASPLVTEEKIFVNPGGEQGKGVIAYHRITGDIIWANGNDPASYCAPCIKKVDNVEQLLIFDGYGLKGHDIETGEELWRFESTNTPKVNAAQPIVQEENLIFIGSGYGVGAALLQVTHNKNEWTVTTKYTIKNRCKLKFNDAVYKEGYVYGLDEGILACYEFKTGKRMWKKGRYQYGQILLTGEHILVLAQDGKVALVEANPDQFIEVGKFNAIEGKTWNHPVLHQGKLYVRNAEEAACYQLR